MKYRNNKEGKKLYVAECLKPAIMESDSAWADVYYETNNEEEGSPTEYEYVWCINKNSDKTLKINVFADSLSAVLEDVMKRVCRL